MSCDQFNVLHENRNCHQEDDEGFMYKSGYEHSTIDFQISNKPSMHNTPKLNGVKIWKTGKDEYVQFASHT